MRQFRPSSCVVCARWHRTSEGLGVLRGGAGCLVLKPGRAQALVHGPGPTSAHATFMKSGKAYSRDTQCGASAWEACDEAAEASAGSGGVEFICRPSRQERHPAARPDETHRPSEKTPTYGRATHGYQPDGRCPGHTAPAEAADGADTHSAPRHPAGQHVGPRFLSVVRALPVRRGRPDYITRMPRPGQDFLRTPHKPEWPPFWLARGSLGRADDVLRHAVCMRLCPPLRGPGRLEPVRRRGG
jgi:hypothetical protein